MPLLEMGSDGAAVIEDLFPRVADDEALPELGNVLVSLDRFVAEKDALLSRGGDLGVWLRSDQTPEEIGGNLDRLALIALDFPVFSDGRSYSSARLLRERLGFKGELRAIGDVLREQLSFMLRSGFVSFEMEQAVELEELALLVDEVSVVYQPTGDGQPTAIDFRIGTPASES